MRSASASPRRRPRRDRRRAIRARAAWGLWCALALLGCGASPEAPHAVGGVLDLSDWRFEQRGPVRIQGEWEICWGAFVSPREGRCAGLHGGWTTFPVPRLWSDSSVTSPIGGRGIASYRLRIRLPTQSHRLALRVGAPMTAHRLWIDSIERGGVGTVGTTADTTVARLANHEYALPQDASSVEIVVHVANFAFRGGGLRRQWFLGTSEQIAARNGYELLAYSAFMSLCIVLGLVFLVQFALRPHEVARGWFGAFALVVGLRVVPGSTSDLYQLLMGWASFDALIRLEYANTALVIFLLGGYLRTKIPDVMPPRLTGGLQLTALALVPVHALAPLDMALGTLPIILAVSTLGVVLVVASYGRAFRRGVRAAGPTLGASLLVGVGILHDVFRTSTGLGAPIELFPYFQLAWMAVEASALLHSFARSVTRVEELSDQLHDANFELQETEQAVVRFVPFDFLRALGARTIRDVRPGDHVQAVMTVMSCALRVPEPQTFALVNQLLGRIEQAITAHGGFVAQNLGGVLLALFPGPAAQAADAAVEIRDGVRELAGAAGAGDAWVGIGVATGPVLLGTVGGEERLACVVLGEAVRRAASLQTLAEESGFELLLCQSVRAGLGPDTEYELRPVRPSELGSEAGARSIYQLR